MPSFSQDVTIHPPNYRLIIYNKHTLRNGEGWDFFGVYMLNIKYIYIYVDVCTHMLLNAMDVVTGEGYALPEGLRLSIVKSGTT